MKPIRVSVSDLDTYRYYRQNEDVTLEDCIARLRHTAPATPAMVAGRALHKILEQTAYDAPEVVSLKGSGHQFNFDCDVDLQVPTVRELKGEIEIETPSGPVTLVGIVDAMDTAIYDYKLTGQFDAERLANSYQWRCYLLMFKASKFVYRVFVGKEMGTGSSFDGQQLIGWTIFDYHELPVYRYPGMEDDVKREVAEFAAFSRQYLTGAAQ